MLFELSTSISDDLLSKCLNSMSVLDETSCSNKIREVFCSGINTGGIMDKRDLSIPEKLNLQPTGPDSEE